MKKNNDSQTKANRCGRTRTAAALRHGPCRRGACPAWPPPATREVSSSRAWPPPAAGRGYPHASPAAGNPVLLVAAARRGEEAARAPAARRRGEAARARRPPPGRSARPCVRPPPGEAARAPLAVEEPVPATARPHVPARAAPPPWLARARSGSRTRPCLLRGEERKRKLIRLRRKRGEEK
ncbi:unnamed protein product [Urochloa humidicola]